MNKSRSMNSRQVGMTLVELMIALLLGAFLLGGIIQVFVNAKQSYRLQDNLSRMQENGRLAIDFLTRDLRMTGFWGCLSRNTLDVPGDITGGDSTITLRGVFSPQKIDTGAITFLDDVSPPTASCGTIIDKTKIYYTDNSSTINYYLSNNTLRINTKGLDQELIQGIDNMQFLYGEDTNADKYADYYVTAGNVVNWENVVSIRINLLIRSLDDNLTNTKLGYFYLGTTQAAAADYRLRRAFTATIAVRNRLP